MTGKSGNRSYNRPGSRPNTLTYTSFALDAGHFRNYLCYKMDPKNNGSFSGPRRNPRFDRSSGTFTEKWIFHHLSREIGDRPIFENVRDSLFSLAANRLHRFLDRTSNRTDLVRLGIVKVEKRSILGRPIDIEQRDLFHR